MRKPTRKSLKAKADRLFSLRVRSKGFCEASGRTTVRCGGVLQAAHIIGRRYHSTRWNPLNALCLCAGHHVFYTHHPEAWRDFLDEWWPGRYETVWGLAQVKWDGDLDGVLDDLVEQEAG